MRLRSATAAGRLRCALLGMATLGAAASLATFAPAHAKPAWDQAANVKGAAERLAVMQTRQGADAVVKFLDACYRTHTLASQFSQALEACMAQDVMFSKVLAEVYTRIPAAELTKRGLPEPARIGRAMSGRVASVAAQYKLGKPDLDALGAAIEAHGMPIYFKAVFPGIARQPAEAPAGGAPAAGQRP
jgi:hypothetical protein